MSEENASFNEDFYLPREQQLIKIIQEEVGCFNCNAKGATKTCSACKFAMYCSRDCQSHHWKKNSTGTLGKDQPHNGICKMIKEIRKDKKQPFPLLLAPVGGFSEGMVTSDMKLRSNLFLNEAVRIKVEDMSLSVLCVEDSMIDEHTVRLISTARIILPTHFINYDIHYVIHQRVDKGKDAIKRLFPSDGSSGSLSDEAKQKSIENIIDFINRVHKKGIRVTSITCGRGLGWIENDDDTKKKFNEANGEQISVMLDAHS